jgi:hypothetical protein
MSSGRVGAALLLSAALLACSDSPTRTDQARQIASSAGLATDVADFIATATAGGNGIYAVTYHTTATDGSAQQITVTQQPPDRRVDIYGADGTIDSTIRTGGTSYQCTKGQAWTCAALGDQTADPNGVLDAKTVTAAIEQLTSRAADYDFRVESRSMLGVTARCLVTTLKPGHSDPSLGASATLCLAPSGAQLLVDVPRGKLEATDYTTAIPPDVFALPAQPSGTVPPGSAASSSGG